MLAGKWKSLRRLLLLVLFALPAWAQPVHVLTLDGAVGPAGADYIGRALDKAAAANAKLVVLKIDTPGGLDIAMRSIIKAILASPVPVAAYVAPSGARAASAGTYILYASHVAAMAPGTNLGAATPVMIGGSGAPAKDEPVAKPAERPGQGKEAPAGDAMTRKQVHDAAAYIRGLAELRGRNAEWAERAVREAVSLSAPEAVKLKVVDLVAADVDDLLVKIDGRTVKMADGALKTLETKGAQVVAVEPDWRARILAIIANPAFAYILMLLGMYGLFFEFSSPGFGLPGIAGAICLLLALFAFQLLPVSYVGLALIGLGLAFMVAEALLGSYGMLAVGGVVAFVLGSIMLIDTDAPGYGIPWQVILPSAIVSVAFMLFVVGVALRARKLPVKMGRDTLLGATGVVERGGDAEAWANIQGEIWHVRSAAPLARGTRVRVIAVTGLLLKVEALDGVQADSGLTVSGGV